MTTVEVNNNRGESYKFWPVLGSINARLIPEVVARTNILVTSR